jgi:hypothetical protein
MLSKQMRKKLNEHSWLWIEKQESNPSQTWQRLKKQSVTAINDLTLLANKLPEDKQEEIFSPNRIEDLIAQIIHIGFFSQSHENFNSRKSEIASRLTKRGIDLNIDQYVNSSPETPSLIKPTLDHLKQTVDICSDISYKMRLRNIDEEVKGSEYQYLFSWKNMLTREKNRLISLILSNSFNFDTDILKVEDKGKRRVIDFGIDTGDSKNIPQGTLRIAINNTYTRAEACIFDVHHQIIWKDELLVKEIVKDTSLSWRNNLMYINVLDHGNDFNFYIKVTDRPKKQAKQLK